MSDFLRRYRAQIFLSMAVVLLFGAFMGFGGYFFGPKGPNESVAEVEGEKIPLRLYYGRYERALEQLPADKRLDDATRNQKRDETLRDLIQGVIFDRLAKKAGIVVTDSQVVNSLVQIPAFQTKGAFDRGLYERALRYQLKTTPQDFEEEQRRAIAFYKLRWLIQSSIQVTNPEFDLAWAFQGAEFAKANGYVTNGSGKRGRRRTIEEAKSLFRDQLWQEKVLWCFNQWFTQVGQRARVKVHTEALEGGAR